MDNQPSEETARNRWMAITMARLGSALLVVLGLLIVQRTIALPEPVAYVLIVAGLVGTFVVPQWLAKRWRSRDQ